MIPDGLMDALHPLHRSVTEEIFVAGIPYNLFYSLWIISAIIVLSLGQFWYLIIGVIAHFICVLLHTRDENLFQIARAVFFQVDRLHD